MQPEGNFPIKFSNNFYHKIFINLKSLTISNVQLIQFKRSKLNVCGPFVKCEITAREWLKHLYPKWATIKITIWKEINDVGRDGGRVRDEHTNFFVWMEIKRFKL